MKEGECAHFRVGFDDGLPARPVRLFGVGPEEFVMLLSFGSRVRSHRGGRGGSKRHDLELGGGGVELCIHFDLCWLKLTLPESDSAFSCSEKR